MLDKLRQTAKHTIIYSLGNISTKLAGLILLPFYTNHISIAEYGMLSIIETTTVFLVMVLCLNMYVALMRWYPDAKTNIEQKIVVSTAFFPTIIFVFFASFILSLFSKQFSLLFFGNTNSYVFFNYMIASIVLTIINSFATTLIRVKQKSIYFTIVSLVSLVITLTLNIYLTGTLDMGLNGILISQLVGSGLQFVMFLPILLKFLVFKIDKKILLGMIAYAAPLVLASFSTQLLNMGDRYIIPYFLSYASLGVYSVGYKISGVISVFIITSFQMGFLPIAFKMFDKPDAKAFFKKVLTYFTLILLFAALGISLYSNELLMLLAPYNEEYRLGAKYIPFIAFLLVFKGMEYVIMLGLHYTKKTKYNAIILFGGFTLNILLNVILIKYLELYGVAISSLTSGILVTFFYYKMSNKVYPIDYELKKIAKLFILSISIFLITFLFADFNIYLRLVLKTILIVSFPILLFLINFFDKKEIEAINGFYQKWKNPTKWKQNINNILKKKSEEN